MAVIMGASAVRSGDLLVKGLFIGDELVWRPDPVTFTVEGTEFSPILQLATGATTSIEWRSDDDDTVLATGPTPTITWADSGPHQVKLVASNVGDIEGLNLGFHEGQDNGLYSLSSANRHPTQPVTAIDNLQVLHGLRRFMAARTDGVSADGSLYTGPLLTGHLNFSGMTNLQYIECFQSEVHSVALTGCTGIIRLCLEQCNIEYIDLNPVRVPLRDLRMAVQQGGTLEFAPMEGPFENLYHFCTRRTNIVNMPAMTDLPAIQQLWIWNCDYHTDTLTVRSSETVHSVLLSSTTTGPGTTNTIQHLDVAGVTFGTTISGPPRIVAEGVGLQSIDLSGVSGVRQLRLENNGLTQATVDAILAECDNSWGGSQSGVIALGGSNHYPSPTGLDAVASLRSKGWTVTHTASPIPTVLLWSDEFDRADASGWEAVGAPWQQPIGGSDISITGGDLTVSGGSSYQRYFALPPELDGIRNYDVEVEIDSTHMADGWFGVLARMDAAGAGAKALFTGSWQTAAPRSGSATSASGTTMTEEQGFPAGWTDPGIHKIRWRLNGNYSQLYLDDQLAFRYNASAIAGAGNGVGFCGTTPRVWRAIRVYQVPA